MIIFHSNEYLKIEKYENAHFYKNAYLNERKHQIIKENNENYQPFILKHPKIYKNKISLEDFEILNEKHFDFKNEKVYICFHQYEPNFHHFIFDSFYQIFGYLELKKQIPDLKLFTSKIQSSINNFREYIFNLFGIKDIIYFNRLEKRNTLNYHFQEIYVPIPIDVFKFFNELNLKINQIIIEKPFFIETYDKLFIVRSLTSLNDQEVVGKRLLLNTIEISNYLKEYGYKTIRLEEYNLLEKYKIMNNAKKINVELGASCDNLIFCNKNCKINILTNEVMSRPWLKFHQNLLKNLNLQGDVLNIGIPISDNHHHEISWYLEEKNFNKLI